MRLPIEVSEAVIDEASDDTASLCDLSLTCAAFLPRSRFHLWGSIVVRDVKRMESSPDFFDEHPWLVPLVNKVTLFPKSLPQEYHSKRNIRPLDMVPVHLLTRLPNLRSWAMAAPPDLTLSRREPSLSLPHRTTLAVYRRYSSRIQSLDLSEIRFYCLSDFTGLLAAFTAVQTLSCASIQFRREPEEELDVSLYVGRTGMLSRPSRVSTLTIRGGVDTRAREYMLGRCGDTLSSLTLHVRGDIEWLEKSMSGLARLSSLTIVLRMFHRDIGYFTESSDMRSIARILESAKRACLTDVRVELQSDPIAALGTLLSGPDPLVEACQLLEKALLTFPNPRILVYDSGEYWRMGRAALWSPIIKDAFPMLNQRGLVNLDFKHSKTNSAYPFGHEYKVTSLVTSHDSRWIVTGSTDDIIIIWNMSSGTVLHEWLAHQGCVSALALSPDSRRLVSAGGRTLVVWAFNNGVQKAAELQGHTDTVTTCAWSPDGYLIASAAADRTVRVWDGRTFQQLHHLLLEHEKLEALQFSPDSRYLAWICGFDCCIWRPLMEKQPKTLPSHPDFDEVYVFALSFDPEGSRIATAHGDYEARPDVTSVVRIWDVATGDALAVLEGPPERQVTDVSFSADGRSLLFVGTDGFVTIWDTDSWENTGMFEDEDGNSASSRASDVESANARDLDWQHPAPESQADDEDSWISIACFSPDGTFIATATGKGLVRLWTRDDDYVSCVATFREHRGRVERIGFFPNGEFLVSGDTRGIVPIRRLSNFVEK